MQTKRALLEQWEAQLDGFPYVIRGYKFPYMREHTSYKTQRPPRTLQINYAWGPKSFLRGRAVSYGRGSPVCNPQTKRALLEHWEAQLDGSLSAPDLEEPGAQPHTPRPGPRTLNPAP